ncbi:radical SAM family heme chaperone HemW [bacterium]|nr:radical SAM family heme chaperone HemW [bacterium]
MFDVSANVRSVYIHWPFCPYRCTFCPFVAFSSHEEYMGRYHDCLCKEIERFETLKERQIETLYIGGGTPSTYPSNLLLDMFGKLRGKFNFSKIREVTIELNPGTVVRDDLKLWCSLGINRLSVGIQSLNDKVLSTLNRRQKSEDVYSLLKMAPIYFSNISVDLIIGLPGVSDDEWKKYMREVVSWPITHVSIYFLSVHEETKLYFGVKSKKIMLPTDDRIVSLYKWSADFLASKGFERYEISSFARSGYQSIHNKIYWDRVPYKAFGISGCSFDGKTRFKNEAKLVPYFEKIDRGDDTEVYSEVIEKEQVLLEILMLGLRQERGIRIKEILSYYSEQEKKELLSLISDLKIKGFVDFDGKILRLFSKGIPLENEIVLKLFQIKDGRKNLSDRF